MGGKKEGTFIFAPRSFRNSSKFFHSTGRRPSSFIFALLVEEMRRSPPFRDVSGGRTAKITSVRVAEEQQKEK